MRNGRLSELINIGYQTEQLLNEVGIHTRYDLEKIGPVQAWRRIQIKQPEKITLQHLYRLAGALQGTHWQKLPNETMAQLHEEIGKTANSP